jgi:hypothetical protein
LEFEYYRAITIRWRRVLAACLRGVGQVVQAKPAASGERVVRCGPIAAGRCLPARPP